MQVKEDLVNEDNVYVRYRLDGSLFNLSYRAFKLTPRLMRGLSETFSSQMMLMYHFLLRKCCPAFWPRGQPEEDGGPYQPAPREEYHPPHITISETKLTSVQQFSYLGCTISSDARIDKEVDIQSKQCLRQTI